MIDGDGENVCKNEANGGLIPDPRTCYNYIQCVHKRSYVRPCPANLFFNPVGKYCDWPKNTLCPGNRCSTNNGRCEQNCVYIDNNNYGCTCRSGFKLDTDRRSCIAGAINMDTYCQGRHGDTLPDPLKCTGFIKCQGDKSIPFLCPPGLVYSSVAKVCDFKRRGVCSDEDFEAWSLWSPCFKPTPEEDCVRQRTRSCKTGGIYCKGFKSQVEKCSEDDCEATELPSPCALQNGGCTDICTVNNGEAVCSCNPGRTLTNDQKSCTSAQCGMAPLRNDKIIAFIVAGQNVPRGSYPWQVAIYFLYTEDGVETKSFHCGGTLIGNRHVISAAHCFSNPEVRSKVDKFKLVLGENNRNRNEGTEQHVNVKAITIHEDFNANTYVNDIAILSLSEDAVYSQYITPACLPTKDEELKVGTSCRITGWGKKFHVRNPVDILQEITVPVVAGEVCQTKNKGVQNVTPSMICTGFDSDWKSACHGDSGGPLSCMSESGVWKLYGVVSWGDPQCNALTAYNVLTKVSHYIDWITANKQAREP